LVQSRFPPGGTYCGRNSTLRRIASSANGEALALRRTCCTWALVLGTHLMAVAADGRIIGSGE